MASATHWWVFPQGAKVSRVQPKAMEAKEAGTATGKEAEVVAGAKEAKDVAKEPREEAKVRFPVPQKTQPAHLLLRQRLAVWKSMKPPSHIVELIKKGVLHQWSQPVL